MWPKHFRKTLRYRNRSHCGDTHEYMTGTIQSKKLMDGLYNVGQKAKKFNRIGYAHGAGYNSNMLFVINQVNIINIIAPNPNKCKFDFTFMHQISYSLVIRLYRKILCTCVVTHFQLGRSSQH